MNNYNPADIWSDEISVDDFFQWASSNLHLGWLGHDVIPRFLAGEGVRYPIDSDKEADASSCGFCLGRKINYTTDFVALEDDLDRFVEETIHWGGEYTPPQEGESHDPTPPVVVDPSERIFDFHISRALYKVFLTTYIRRLGKYKANRYPIILQKRDLERKYAFLTTIKHPKSTISSVLNNVEVNGVLKLIFSFAAERSLKAAS